MESQCHISQQSFKGGGKTIIVSANRDDGRSQVK